jgi:hypothetical protein
MNDCTARGYEDPAEEALLLGLGRRLVLDRRQHAAAAPLSTLLYSVTFFHSKLVYYGKRLLVRGAVRRRLDSSWTAHALRPVDVELPPAPKGVGATELSRACIPHSSASARARAGCG